MVVGALAACGSEPALDAVPLDSFLASCSTGRPFDGQIVACVASAGSEITDLGVEVDLEFRGALAPDRRRFATRIGDRLTVVDLDGEVVQSDSIGVVAADWLDDATVVALAVDRTGAPLELIVWDIAVPEAERLVLTGVDGARPGRTISADPSGTRAVIDLSFRDDTTGLAIADLTTGAAEVVAESPRHIELADPVWSPVTDTILYLKGPSLFLLDLATEQSVPLVHGIDRANAPSWRIDGRSVGYNSGIDIFQVDLDADVPDPVAIFDAGDESYDWDIAPAGNAALS